MEFAFISPYTPEMNPIEQVWSEIRKLGFKNKAFKTLEDVIDKLQEVIQGLYWSVLKSIINRRWLSDIYFWFCLIIKDKRHQKNKQTYKSKFV